MYTGGGRMEQKKLVIADLSVLPPVYHKILQVKELLESGQAETVNEAANMADVSRSAYYKYKDYVFPFNQMQGILTLLIAVIDIKGVLSDMLAFMSDAGCNILTINQNVPVNGVANITVTVQTENMRLSTDRLISGLQCVRGVRKVNILAKQ
ncbi:MAG: ACT domain-containing protein [Ruminococcaceae bacterium]|nr:ACT domain-containing protein [Oscillospiraceae bacterium]